MTTHICTYYVNTALPTGPCTDCDTYLVRSDWAATSGPMYICQGDHFVEVPGTTEYRPHWRPVPDTVSESTFLLMAVSLGALVTVCTLVIANEIHKIRRILAAAKRKERK